MADVLAAIEQLALVRAIKASFFTYPVINALHILSIGALLTGIFLLDLRILGAFRSVPFIPFSALLRRLALVAFACAIVTGLLLVSVRASEYATKPVFLVKMSLILVAGLNFLAFALVSRNQGKAAALFATLSLVLWTSALFAGRFIGFL